MVKIEFEFPTIDAAIVALAKLNAPLPKDKPTVPVGHNDDKERQDLQAGKTRKPRADKGKERGSYRNAAVAESSPSSAPGNPGSGANAVATPSAENSPAAPTGAATVAPSTIAQVAEAVTPAAPSSAANTPAAVVPSLDEAQAALSSVFEAHGLPLAQGVLSRFGVQRLRDLLPEQRADFIKAAAEAVKEGKA